MQFEKDAEFHQQGDIHLIKIKSIPQEARRLSVPPTGFILAEGEATGHKHVLTCLDNGVALAEPGTETPSKEKIGEGIEVFEHNGTLFVKTSVPTKVTHQEHGTTLVDPGIYQVGHVQEYDHFQEEARRVAD